VVDEKLITASVLSLLNYPKKFGQNKKVTSYDGVSSRRTKFSFIKGYERMESHENWW
jgi:hypothetical protein